MIFLAEKLPGCSKTGRVSGKSAATNDLASEQALECELKRNSLRSSQVKKPGGLYENDKPRKTLDRRSTTVHPNDRIERSGGTRQEADYFIPQLRDHLHARTCLSVQPVWLFLREALIEKCFPSFVLAKDGLLPVCSRSPSTSSLIKHLRPTPSLALIFSAPPR